jgi:pectate lyase
MASAPKKSSRKRKVIIAAGMATVVAGMGGLASVSFADADAATATVSAKVKAGVGTGRI